MSHPHQIVDRDAMRSFVLGGRAYFTLLNTLTGGRVTYCVEKDSDVEGASIVRAFTGSDNADRRAYSYLGNLQPSGPYHYAGAQAAIDALLVVAEEKQDSWLVGFCKNIRDKGTLTLRQKAALARNIATHGVVTTALLPDDVKAKGFAWFWRTLTSGREFPAGFEFWHEGRCARCSRRLTVPESVASGFGPECVKLVAGSQVLALFPTPTHPA